MYFDPRSTKPDDSHNPDGDHPKASSARLPKFDPSTVPANVLRALERQKEKLTHLGRLGEFRTLERRVVLELSVYMAATIRSQEKGNSAQVARDIGLPVMTVTNWANGTKTPIRCSALLRRKDSDDVELLKQEHLAEERAYLLGCYIASSLTASPRITMESAKEGLHGAWYKHW
jgi:hypothetical protein